MPEVNRKAPEGKVHTQSMRFKKDKWTKTEAEKWVKEHDGYIDGYDEALNEHRFRQYDPEDDKFEYRALTKDLPKGVYFIVGYPKRKKDLSLDEIKQFYRESKNEQTILHRTIDLVGNECDVEKRVISLAFASEQPVNRWYGKEVLSMNPEHCDLSRLRNKAPLLLQHDPSQLIGVIESAEIGSDKVGRAIVRLSRRDDVKDVIIDIDDGILTKTSVGYMLNDVVKEEWNEDKTERTITWSWTPFEISLVSVPADDSVGVGRGVLPAFDPSADVQTKQMPTLKASEEVIMPEVKEEAKVAIDVNAERETAAKVERERIAEIIKIGKAYKCEELAQKAVSEGTGLDDFRKQVLEVLSKRQPESPAIGMNEKEIKEYSFVKAIRHLAGDRSVDAGLEIEASNAVARKLGRPAKGLFVPFDVQVGKRDLQISGGTGAYFVETKTLAQNFIDALHANSVLSQLGIQTLTGLAGDIAIPKGGTVTGYWVAESNAPTESTPTLTQVTGSPKTVGAYTDISRKLIVQSAVDVEQFVKNEIAKALSAQIDVKAFTGGGSTEPVGLDNVTGVNTPSVTAGTPTYAEMLGFLSDIEADNAMLANLAWAMPPAVFYKLAATAVATSAPVFIADYQTGRVLGYPCVRSSSVKAKTAYFGAWSQCILGIWGNGLDLTVDPYSNSTTGILRIVGFMDVDIMFRRGEAFATAAVLS